MSMTAVKNDVPRRYAIGLDLGGTNLKYGIVSDRGEIIYKNLISAKSEEGGKKVLQVMTDCAHECLRVAKKEKIAIQGLGAGCPGNIDCDRGISLGPTPHIPDWEGVEITKTISQKIQLPVCVDNDANFMTYGEFICGAGTGHHYIVGITLGTGVGGGIIIEGKIYHGAIFNGAEIGHVVVQPDGRACGCGNRGCLERYAGSKAITRDVIDALNNGEESMVTQGIRSHADIDPALILAAADHGDELCGRIVNTMIMYLGAGISSVVNILNPDVVIIGGGISDAGDGFILQIREAVMARMMKPVKAQLKIVRAKLGNDAGILGAGLFVLK